MACDLNMRASVSQLDGLLNTALGQLKIQGADWEDGREVHWESDEP